MSQNDWTFLLYVPELCTDKSKGNTRGNTGIYLVTCRYNVQESLTKKTTTPMIPRCVHVLLWLRAQEVCKMFLWWFCSRFFPCFSLLPSHLRWMKEHSAPLGPRLHTLVFAEREVWWRWSAERLSAAETFNRVSEETWTRLIQQLHSAASRSQEARIVLQRFAAVTSPKMTKSQSRASQ